MKRYPSYKNSGIEWMGEVPANWDVVRLKHITNKIGSGKTPLGGAAVYVSEGVPLIRSQNVLFRGLSLEEVAYITAETDAEMAGSHAFPGDVLLNITGASIGRCCILPDNVVHANVNQHVCIIRPDQKYLLPDYLNAFLVSSLGQMQIFAGEEGISREGLSFEDIGNFNIPLPPLSEQQAITHYLARQTAKIDALITAKQKLLELLVEKRRALITHAITCGLNPDAPLHYSGIEWLGEIPEHWDIVHLRRVLTLMDYGISEFVDIEGKVAVLRMGDIRDGEIHYDKVGFVEEVDPSLLLAPGDLLFNRTNSLDQVGKVGIFRGNSSFPVSFASYLVRMRCGRRVLPEFLNFQLNSQPILAWARGEALPAIGQANLNPNRYSYLPIPLPPLEEQEAITKYLIEKAQKLDDLELATQQAIELLQERRVALISAAVTGQICIPI
jgi:type I restriction enzyme S subunit